MDPVCTVAHAIADPVIAMVPATVWGYVSTGVTIAALVTASLPMPKTGPLKVVGDVLNVIAGNIGHAKNATNVLPPSA